MTTTVGELVAMLSADAIRSDTITLDGTPYMERFHYRYELDGSARLHHLLTDDPEHMHDHPWNYATVLLTGAYREHTPDGWTDHHAPVLLTRQAEHVHRLELLAGPMWTYIVTGPVRRRWGYWTDDGWMPWCQYQAERVA